MQLDGSYESIYEYANALVADGHWEEAVQEYKRILNRLSKLSPQTRSRQPNLDDLLSNVALELTTLLMRMSDYDQAIEISDRLVDVFPDARSYWTRNRAFCLAQKGEVDQGLSELLLLAQEEPNDFLIALNLGQVYSRIEAHDEAIEHLNRAIESADKNEMKALVCHHLLGIYITLGQSDKVAETWQRLVSFDRSAKVTISDLYDYYLEKGETQRATALVIEDENPLRRGLYSGLIDYGEGNKESAEREWGKVIRREVDEETEGLEYWMETGLRVGQAQRVIDKVMPIFAAGKVTFGPAILFGIAWAVKGDIERSDSFFHVVRDSLTFKKGDLLSLREWKLLDALVDDETVKAALRHHFENGEKELSGPHIPEAVSIEAPSTEPGQKEAGA